MREEILQPLDNDRPYPGVPLDERLDSNQDGCSDPRPWKVVGLPADITSKVVGPTAEG